MWQNDKVIWDFGKVGRVLVNMRATGPRVAEFADDVRGASHDHSFVIGGTSASFS